MTFFICFDAALLLLIVVCQSLGVNAPVWLWLGIVLVSIGFREMLHCSSQTSNALGVFPQYTNVPRAFPDPVEDTTHRTTTDTTPQQANPPVAASIRNTTSLQRRMQHPDVRSFYSDCLTDLNDKRECGYRMTRGYSMS